jgi:Ca2+-binding EF-hand superfamily protein
MGNSSGKSIDTSKYDLSDLDNNREIDVYEFENIYEKKTGDRPSSKDWLNFMKCDKNHNYKISIGEYIQYMQTQE